MKERSSINQDCLRFNRQGFFGSFCQLLLQPGLSSPKKRKKQGCLKKKKKSLISSQRLLCIVLMGFLRFSKKKSQNIALILSCFSRYSEQKRQFSCCEQPQTRPIVELDCTAKCTYSIPSAQQPFMTHIIAGLLRPNNCKNFKEKSLRQLK